MKNENEMIYLIGNNLFICFKEHIYKVDNLTNDKNVSLLNVSIEKTKKEKLLEMM